MPSKNQIKVGGVTVGGGAPITVQSMTTTKTSDIPATVEQIRHLQSVGCDIVRVAVPDAESAAAIEKIKESIDVPLVADIHFDHKLALISMERGIDAIRINPGNIGGGAALGYCAEKIRSLVAMAKSKGIPIRIGVNGGSLERDILEKYSLAKYSRPTLEALVESAARHIEILERLDFGDIAVSVKSSSVTDTIAANRIMAARFDYPLHLGVTEAGTIRGGLVKSAIGIGALLADGIGDTIRVSLTADPVEEVYAARLILQSLGLFPQPYEIISCPTCGRCNIDIISIATEVEEKLLAGTTTLGRPKDIYRLGRNDKSRTVKGDRTYTTGTNNDRNIKIAIMGCAVNGPGEARDADIGIAGGDGEAVLFKKGEIVGKIAAEKIVETLLKEIENAHIT